ncbi:DUF5710 domain-containing protein [Methyloprofundus sp.]|uniref:DUF5710 domain-containing protein n=1 Tax=Methyloprofundus sp. TaxID=2020875 RepID=UPI003D0DBC23
MKTSKTYLNVSYAEKDAAKALGARWDANKKKWYVPENLDTSVFSKWHTDSASATAKTKKITNSNPLTGIITHAKDANFVAYSGDKPPWD